MEWDSSERAQAERALFSLDRLCITFLVFISASRVFTKLLRYHRGEFMPWGVAMHWFSVEGLFTLTALVTVLFVYRPVASLLRAAPPGPRGGRTLRGDALIGLGAGLLVVLAAIPIEPDGLVTLVLFPTPHQAGLWGVANCILFGLALPVATEVVFRGVVLRTLEACLEPAVAVTVAGVASAVLVPIFNNWLIGLALGLLAGYLYHRRRTLVGPIIAGVTATTGLMLWSIYS